MSQTVYIQPAPSVGAVRLGLRRVVLSTYIGPLATLYRGIYQTLMSRCVRMFSRCAGLQAVYAIRGAATGDVLPGVSNLNFTLVTDSSSDLTTLRRHYGRLARLTGLLDPDVEIVTRDRLHHLYATNPHWQYRIMEGKSTWRLLWGRDYLHELSPLTPQALEPGLYAEMKAWWALFARRLFVTNAASCDAVGQRSLCYQAVSEILKMDLGISDRRLTFSRQKALNWARSQLSSDGQALTERLVASRTSRFLRTDPSLLEDSTNFLIQFLTDFAARQCEEAAPTAGARNVQTDLARNEWFAAGDEDAHVRRLIDHAKAKWGESYLAASLITSASFGLDDLLLMLWVHPTRTPTVAQLRGLMDLYWTQQPGLRRRVHLYLVLPQAALQIDAADPAVSAHSILTPASNPEVFDLLARDEFVVDGTRTATASASAWTDIAESSVRETLATTREQIETLPESASTLEFLRTFWQAARAAAIALSSAAKPSDQLDTAEAQAAVVYPLTPAAVVRQLEACGQPLPKELEPLVQAYHAEVAGEASGVGALRQRAMQYLKEIVR